MAPLGYESRDRKLIVVEEEAERVRLIFRSYLELGSLSAFLADLRLKGIVSKVRTLSNGRIIGGIPFTRGPLAYLLRNGSTLARWSIKDRSARVSSQPFSTELCLTRYRRG